MYDVEEPQYNPDYEQQQLANMPFMTPLQQYSGSIIHMTNPDNDLIKIEDALRCRIVNKDGSIHQYGDPLLNEKGVNSVISQIRAIVNRSSIMSNFEDKEVSSLVLFLAETLAKDLMINRVTYQIQSREARDTIYYIALTNAYIVLKRGYQQGERRFWKGSQQEIHTSGGTQEKSAISKIFGWNK